MDQALICSGFASSTLQSDYVRDIHYTQKRAVVPSWRATQLRIRWALGALANIYLNSKFRQRPLLIHTATELNAQSIDLIVPKEAA